MQFESVYAPYGADWSTPFPRWQGSFASLHPIVFEAELTLLRASVNIVVPGQIRPRSRLRVSTSRYS